MKSLIVFKSYHHDNTEKIAKEMASVLNADMLRLENVNPSSLKGFDLIGFGSGIYGFGFHKDFLPFVESLPLQKGRCCFVFSTSSGGSEKYNEKAKESLEAKGFKCIGSFSCKGFNTFGPLKFVGGLSKSHPDKKDLENAKKFAKGLEK